MNPEEIGQLSEKDRKMMGFAAETDNSSKMEAVKKEAEQAMIAAFGSVEEAKRYANMKKTEQILRPNPDAGIEKDLAGKITIARNLLYVLEGGNGNILDAEDTLTSTKTSTGFNSLSRKN